MVPLPPSRLAEAVEVCAEDLVSLGRLTEELDIDLLTEEVEAEFTPVFRSLVTAARGAQTPPLPE